MHHPSIILHSDTTSKRGFNMAAKIKKSAASDKSTVIRESKQQQHQQQRQQYLQSPPRQQYLIKDDETLLIDPAIVAAENPDVSSVIFSYARAARPLKLFWHFWPFIPCFDTLHPCYRIIHHLPSLNAAALVRPYQLSKSPLHPTSSLSPTYLALCSLQQLLPSFLHWYTLLSGQKRNTNVHRHFSNVLHLVLSIKP